VAVSIDLRSRHGLRSIASRQHPSPITQHDQPGQILGNTASIDRAGDRQVVVLIDDLLLAGAFAALLEQLYGILPLVSDTMPFLESRATGVLGQPAKTSTSGLPKPILGSVTSA
jgi:hypothetical protein